MSNDRGMMKWAPYRSLNEQEKALSAMRKEKAKKPKPHLSEEAAEEINRLLRNYHGQQVIVRYWEAGFCYVLQGFLSKFSAEGRYLIINSQRIPLSLIVGVSEM